MDQGQRIIVIGAGVSGLTAAYRLQKQGHRVTVLERSDYVGGKVKTTVRDGYMMEHGASILPSKYQHTMALVDELGLQSELQAGGSILGFCRGKDIHYMDANHLVRDSLTTGLISWSSKLKMARIGFDSLRVKHKLAYETLAAAADMDFETAEQYTLRRGNQEIFDYIVDGILRGLLGTSGEQMSVLDFFFNFNNVFGSKLLSFKQGMGFFPHALAQHLDVRLNSTAQEVLPGPNGVAVSWTGPDGAHTEQVDGVVVAMPTGVTSDLIPSLPAEAHTLLQGVRYSTIVTASVGLAHPPKDIPAMLLQIPKPVHPDFFGIVLDHNKAPGRAPAGKGLATLYAMTDWSEQLYDQSDERVVAQLLQAAETVLPNLSSLVEFSHVNRWDPTIVYSTPGLYRDVLPRLVALQQQVPRVTFAGDYFSCSNVNSAVASGERAAREMAVKLAPVQAGANPL
ncbi:MAG TPA: FAD-dependent oxidoreductase [Burkholderiaceae bacterium]|nr:FAD-dependent oxidoreductase [Burkholderiaceae bacterium]